MKKRLQQPLAILLTILIAFSALVSTGTVANAAGVPQTLASWGITVLPTPGSIPATGGAQKDSGAYLTSNTGKAWGYATASLNTTGWDNGAGSKYWEISISSKGFDSLKLSAQTRSSATGPRDWKVQYSTDGIQFTDVGGSNYSLGGGTQDTRLKNWMPDLTLPSEACNQATLKIRLILASNKSLKDQDIASAGVSNINNVFIKGTPVTDESVVNGVVAEPASGSAVAIGQALSLSCATADATIIYKINGGDEQTYDSANKPILDVLPATVVAYATKDGMTDSASATFQYTQAIVDSVTAKPNGGSVKIGDLITLKCETADSHITYSIDDGTTWIPYSAPFAVTKLPTTVLAKATATGMTDSPQASFVFDERVNEDYNIYFGQLHSHTTNSDGIGTVTEAFEHASKVDGLDFLAVTDHSNSLETNAGTASLEDGSSSDKWLYGKASAKEITDRKVTKGDHTFLGIYGFEMTWSNGIGHINTYDTKGFENRNTAKYKLSNALSTYYSRLVENPDSISQFNHPGTTFGDFNDFADYNPQIDNSITMIEVGNGEGPIRSSGYFPSYEYYTRALDKGWHVAPTNNQDNHKGLWGDANTARSVILADTLTEDSLYDAMRNRRIYATEDNNLRIEYKLNNEIMGSILESKPDDVNIDVKISDPDKEAIGKVEVVVNGGKVAATKAVTSSDEDVTFQLPTNYSYYYIRVTQPDKDIAVTAPVWVGEVDKAGISKTTASAALPIKGEELTITSSLFNNESVPMNVTSLEYLIDGTTIQSATDIGTVDSLSAKDYSFKYTSAKSGSCNVDVKLVATINGVEKIFTDVLKLNFADPKVVTKVLIDGTHGNDYVNGYYAKNMGNLTAIAAADQIQVKIETTQITKEMLDGVSLFIISAPAKKKGADNGVTYTPQTFNDDFIAMVKEYVANGGTVITCGLADYQDGTADPYTSSTQINDLLKEIGAGSAINSDEVVDDVTNGGQKYRLYLTNVNKDSPYLQGVVDGQKYSFYSGCTVTPGANANWLVKGFDTTYSINSKMTNGKYESTIPASTGSAPYDASKAVKKQGDVYVLTQEKVGKGNVFVAGTVFMSDFEVKAAMENYADLQYANYTIINNILASIKKEIETTQIGEVRKQALGETFAVEGIVTAGTQTGNAFFDTIYIQDETGGINIFPINSGEIKVGQKVRVVGSLDQYLGDLELRVISADVIDTEINPISATTMTTQQAADYTTNGGMLVQVQGNVTKAVLENNVLSYAMIKDDSDAELRVFIDGYIGSSTELATPLETIVQEGKTISAIGLVSYDTDGARIRVRDRAEIRAVSGPETVQVTGITLNNSKLSLVKGKSGTLVATVTPNNATDKSVTWSSSNTSVATVVNGKVTAVNVGTATITATSNDAGLKATCTVTVTKSSSGSGSSSGSKTGTVPSTAAAFISDTTYDFNVNNAYQFKITSLNGQVPTFGVGTAGVFSVQVVQTSGNDYYFKLIAIGAPGAQAGIYVNGVKLLVATVGSAASKVKSDTTLPFNVKHNKAYTFRITAESKPTFVAGTSSAFKVEFVKAVGKDYYFKVTAIGRVGVACGFYINSQKLPVAVATVSE